ncbi:MAG: hypothetical protein IKU05_01110 [Bacteroidales bacterium]|nr:hypothetical protein [Bacteroidales bacterium]
MNSALEPETEKAVPLVTAEEPFFSVPLSFVEKVKVTDESVYPSATSIVMVADSLA